MLQATKGDLPVRHVLIAVILFFLSIGLSAGCAEAGNKTQNQSATEVNASPLQPAEYFIYHNLMNDKGLIKTDFSDQPSYLSESLGLWMEFLLSKNDAPHFQD